MEYEDLRNVVITAIIAVAIVTIMIAGIHCHTSWNNNIVELAKAGYCQTTAQGTNELVWQRCP